MCAATPPRFEQCYGWQNRNSPGPPHASMLKHCGKYKTIKFAGYRCGASHTRGNLVEHTVKMPSGKTFAHLARTKKVNRKDPAMSNLAGVDSRKRSQKYNWHGDNTW